MRIGEVAALWRYPVKSLRGEPLTHANLAPDGIPGDRGIAIADAETGNVLSGKRVEALLGARAIARPGGAVIQLPDGRAVHTADPDAPEVLSAWLGRRVRLVRPSSGEDATIDSEGSAVFRGFPGTFFDGSPLHLLTTATLAHLADLYPAGAFDPRRFRPNIVIASDLPGPIERGWLGRRLAIGDAAIEITSECRRCVMTTSAQAELPKDRGILQTVAREQDNVVGVNCRAPTAATIEVGAPVELL